MVPTEKQRAQQMLEMFRLEITLAIESMGEQPTTTAECMLTTLQAKNRLTHIIKEKEEAMKARWRHRGLYSSTINQG